MGIWIVHSLQRRRGGRLGICGSWVSSGVFGYAGEELVARLLEVERAEFELGVKVL